MKKAVVEVRISDGTVRGAPALPQEKLRDIELESSGQSYKDISSYPYHAAQTHWRQNMAELYVDHMQIWN